MVSDKVVRIQSCVLGVNVLIWSFANKWNLNVGFPVTGKSSRSLSFYGCKYISAEKNHSSFTFNYNLPPKLQRSYQRALVLKTCDENCLIKRCLFPPNLKQKTANFEISTLKDFWNLVLNIKLNMQKRMYYEWAAVQNYT